jgi:DNA-binding PadR family transcriptional regulator
MRRRLEAVQPTRDPDPADFLPLPGLPFSILVALSEEPRHGWAIIGRLEQLNGGRKLPSSGSLYLALARLEERGLIEVAGGSADDRRRTYRLTALGARVTRLESARLAELVGIAARWLGATGDHR